MSPWAPGPLFMSEMSSEHSGVGSVGTSGGIFTHGARAGKSTRPQNNTQGADHCSHLMDEETQAWRTPESWQRAPRRLWGRNWHPGTPLLTQAQQVT